MEVESFLTLSREEFFKKEKPFKSLHPFVEY